jgi:tetratricopeptide (TPR) repeat protein
MKIRIGIAILLCYSAVNTLAQQHYQLMGLAAANFLQTRNTKFEEIKFPWNMEGTLQADLNEGINYILEDKPALAEGSLNIVLKKDATVWPAYYYRAISWKQRQRYQLALDDLEAVLKLNPNLYEAQVEIARCYLAMNSLTEGERAAKRAIQMDKKRPTA